MAAQRMTGSPGPVSESNELSHDDDLALPNPPQATNNTEVAAEESTPDSDPVEIPSQTAEKVTLPTPPPVSRGAPEDSPPVDDLRLPSAGFQLDHRPHDEVNTDEQNESPPVSDVPTPGQSTNRIPQVSQGTISDMNTEKIMDGLNMFSFRQREESSDDKAGDGKLPDLTTTATLPEMGQDTLASLARMPTPDMNTAVLMDALDTQKIEQRFGSKPAAALSMEHDVQRNTSRQPSFDSGNALIDPEPAQDSSVLKRTHSNHSGSSRSQRDVNFGAHQDATGVPQFLV